MSDPSFHVAQRVADLTSKRGLSVKKLAEQLGMPYRTVQNYLTGKVKIPVEFLDKVCNFFSVEADYILFGGLDIDRNDFSSVINDVFSHILNDVEFTTKHGVQLRSGDSNRFEREDARVAYAQMMIIHLSAALRDGYIDRRLSALSEEGRGSVSPLKEALRFRYSVPKRES